MEKLKVYEDKPENLVPYTNNHKIHSDEQILRLCSSIQAYGFDQPIVVDKNNVIIKGHGRREAAIRMKLKKVPVIKADHLDEDQVKAARIADNKSSATEYNIDFLKFDLKSLEMKDYNLSLTGIRTDELDELLKEIDLGLGDFEKVGEVIGSAPKSSGSIDYKETEMPVLTNDPKSEFENITFILHKDQMAELKEALKLSKDQGDFEGEKNENSNGNSLARIARHFIETIG